MKLLVQIAERIEADRILVIGREISKKFEEFVRGTVQEVQAHFEKGVVKGEFVVLIEGRKNKKNESSSIN